MTMERAEEVSGSQQRVVSVESMRVMVLKRTIAIGGKV